MLERISLVRSHNPELTALYLCDIAMPGKDGPGVAARRRTRFPRLKVLFMSGYSSDMQDVQLAAALFLQKPVSRAELAETLAELQGS